MFWRSLAELHSCGLCKMLDSCMLAVSPLLRKGHNLLSCLGAGLEVVLRALVDQAAGHQVRVQDGKHRRLPVPYDSWDHRRLFRRQTMRMCPSRTQCPFPA